ncbi:MAG: T9SS type A sorting domain-containing protein [Bacteroidales bacterium]|nr:T9SS type A sorting domain-containing protein [Bacteroidales bacterium]
MKRVLLTAALILSMTSFISAQIFLDDFESYNVGEQLVVQNPFDWTTGSYTPGSDADPFIQNLGGNVVHITGTNDLIYEISNLTYSEYEIQFDLYIPDSSEAYFNTLQEFSPTPAWGMQVYFGHNNYGEGAIDGGEILAQTFTFEYDTWLSVKVEIDLDNDWGNFYLNDDWIHGWIWSTGFNGTGTLNQLGGNNFFAWNGGYFSNPNYYFDNYSFASVGPPILNPPQNVTATVVNQNTVLLTWDPPTGGGGGAILEGYNIYLNSYWIDYFTVGSPYPIEFPNLSPGSYIFCVSAVYNEGESVQACADEIIIEAPPPPPAPTNLTGPECYNLGDTIHLTWDYYYGEWIRWDAGVNTGNGIGYLSGGTFSCASHWYPDQLIPYDGLQIMEIEFYNNGDPDATYTIKIWTGPDGINEVLSQEVISFNVDDWNTVVLYTPHTISAAEDLWFGYEITHGPSTFPAGCDDGPAIPYNGDMLFWVDEWVSMSQTLGFNYNWNLAALLGLADGITSQSMSKIVNFPNSGIDIKPCCSQSSTLNPSPNGTKDFLYFNAYVKFPGSSFFVVIGPVTSPFSFVPGESGEYQFFVTAVWDPEGESYPSNIWVVDLCTGIINRTINYIEIFPNPASDIVTIDSEFEIVNLKVYNQTGQIVAEEMVNNKSHRFDVSLLNPGIYFLQIDFKDERILRKIIIE